jgi:hypothetical protein
VGRFVGLTSVKKLAKAWFYNATLKGTYKDIIYPLKYVTVWDTPDDIEPVSPLLQQSGQNVDQKKKETEFHLKERCLQGTLVEGVEEQDITTLRVMQSW